tara:strand:+ start:130 stop:429 length:300 start_codon:yes stop_codon:yes gene_type:complete
MNKNTTKLINSKWEAIGNAQSIMNKTRNDLFDDVALALSRIEGKLSFLNSESLDGGSRIEGGHSQQVAKDVQEEVSQTRKALDKIFVELTDGKNSLFNS